MSLMDTAVTVYEFLNRLDGLQKPGKLLKCNALNIYANRMWQHDCYSLNIASFGLELETVLATQHLRESERQLKRENV